MSSSTDRLPLSALISQLLVAFTIEFDNEFEHRMPHRTTRHGSTPGTAETGPRVPWLVSMAMWVHCMRHVPPDGIAARDLARAAGLTASGTQQMVTRMSKWWGYLTVRPGPAGDRLVQPTRAGRQAQRVWEPLTGEIEERWRKRFGGAEIDRFRAALAGVVAEAGPGLPDYLPVFELRAGQPPDGPPRDDPATAALPALMSRLLLALARDFEGHSGLSLAQYTADGASRLPVSANILRVLGEEPVRVAGIPARSGVAKMAVDNWLGALDKHGYLTIGPDPAGGRAKAARLTPAGTDARDCYIRWSQSIFSERFPAGLAGLRSSAEQLTAGEPGDSPLWRGIEPYPDGWRAQVPRPATLPHYPVVSHRGGFPDGS